MHQQRLARRFLALIFILSTFSVLFSTTTLPASSTDQFTPTPSQQAQAQVIESDDPMVVQEGNWTFQSTPQASGGSYLYSSGSSYDTLTLHFYGSRIEVVYVEHAAFGGFTVEIDGDARRTIFSDSKETVFGSRAVFDYLEPAPHTLRIMGIQGTVAIDAFYAIPHNAEENAATTVSSSVRFIPNMGQFDDEIRFEAQGANGTAYYMDNEVLLLLPLPPSDPNSLIAPDQRPDERPTEEFVPDTVRMQFEGANANPNILSLQRLPGEINYFIGNDDSDWHTNVPIYGTIVYEDLYPGVDVVFDETSSPLQGTFTIDGGVDLSQIRWRYEGATNLQIDEVTSELLFDVAPNATRTAQAESATPVQHRQPAPSAWQETGGQRAATPIDLQYTINADGTVGFAVQGYNATQPLTIALFSGGGMMEAAIVEPPPSQIGFSSYLGGSSFTDSIIDVAGDSTGNMYVTGNMPSSAISGGIIGVGGTDAVFVAKFNSDNSLAFITYIGGSSTDKSEGIDVDSGGNSYITGYTASANFPVLNAYQATCTVPSNCGWEAFVVKISASGSTLLYGTYLGDTATDWARAIVVDDYNQVYVTGFTDTVDDWNDCTNPYCGNDARGHDFFVVKLDLDNSGEDQLEYGAIWGGAGELLQYRDDDPTDIAIDSQGNIAVVGYTDTTDFPTTSGVFQEDCIGYETKACFSPFVTVFVAVNDTLGFYRSTYLDGTHVDEAKGVAFDDNSNVYVVGQTYSLDFPTPNGAQTSSINEGTTLRLDGFLAKMPFDLSSVLYGTYLSGNDADVAYGVAVNDAGIAYVTGYTSSTNFPTTTDAIQATNSGYNDVFFARIDTNQTGLASLLESTYWGGSYYEQGNAIAEADGVFYIAGNTSSPDLPIINGYQTGFGGSQDGFMMRLQGQNMPVCGTVQLGGVNVRDEPTLNGSIVLDHEFEGDADITGITYSPEAEDHPNPNTRYPLWYRIEASTTGGDVTGWLAEDVFEVEECVAPLVDHQARFSPLPESSTTQRLSFTNSAEDEYTEAVYTIAQIAEITNDIEANPSPVDTISAGTPVIITGIHLNRQYIRVKYLDGQGELTTDEDRWIRVRRYNQDSYTDITLPVYQIDTINGTSVAMLNPDEEWKQDILDNRAGIEDLIIEEVVLPECLIDQIVNCKPPDPQFDCPEIFGCDENGRAYTALVLNSFQDEEDGCNNTTCPGDCRGWNPRSNNPMTEAQGWHCGVDLVTQTDVENDETSARTVYNIEGGLIMDFYSNVVTFKLNVWAEGDPNDDRYEIHQHQYIHLDLQDLLVVDSNASPKNKKLKEELKGEYLATGILLGEYGPYGQWGEVDAHVHYVQKNFWAPSSYERLDRLGDSLIRVRNEDDTDQYEVPPNFAGIDENSRYVPVNHPGATRTNLVGDELQQNSPMGVNIVIPRCCDYSYDTANLPTELSIPDDPPNDRNVWITGIITAQPMVYEVEITITDSDRDRTGRVRIIWTIEQ